jgi:hypothetical protein
LEAFAIPQVILVPMYDYCPHIREYWNKYRNFKMVCFSKTLFDELDCWGLRTFRAQYYPQPLPIANTTQDSSLRGFFWPRTKDLGWSTLRKLMAGSNFESFHFHWTRNLNPDMTDLPSKAETERFSIKTSTWFESFVDYSDAVRKCNIFFASRRMEGLGMAFLEAMAWGLCVVAPDFPVMNEYIQNGRNGLLYDPDDPNGLEFSNHRALGRAAYESCVAGRQKWESSFDDMKSFILERSRGPYFRRHPFVRTKKRGYAMLRSIYKQLKGVGNRNKAMGC